MSQPLISHATYKQSHLSDCVLIPHIVLTGRFFDIPIPALDLDEDGSIALYSFDSHGYVIADLELLDETNRVAYITYDNEHRVACTGCFNLESKTEIEEFFKKLVIERSS